MRFNQPLLPTAVMFTKSARAMTGARRCDSEGAGIRSPIQATRQQCTIETWTFLVGPTLTRLQFHWAIGTASIASQIVSVQTPWREFTVNVHSVEADWDGEVIFRDTPSGRFIR